MFKIVVVDRRHTDVTSGLDLFAIETGLPIFCCRGRSKRSGVGRRERRFFVFDKKSTDPLKTLAQKSTSAVKKTLGHRHALQRIAARGLEINTVIDVGAAKGDWSRLARKHWPASHVHFIEAKEHWRADLQRFIEDDGPASLSINAASDAPGSIYFPVDGEPYGGAAFKAAGARTDLTEVTATSLDADVEAFNLRGPFAVKLDTHGTERDIIAGAENMLSETALLCIEAYSLIGQLAFPDLIIFLRKRGFTCVDIAEPVFRPVDASLWQLDFYFMRADHPMFKTRGFSG